MAVAVKEQRDPAFWQRVFEHPQVNHIGFGQIIDMNLICASEKVIPLASEHGGFIFVRLDGLGRVYELHTLFEPEGWGREVHGAAISAFQHMFGLGVDLIVTFETGHAQSRAPKTFGFKAAADFSPSALGDLRISALSRADWEQSVARRRACH